MYERGCGEMCGSKPGCCPQRRDIRYRPFSIVPGQNVGEG
jgi:hypothetical protein